jgi:UDP-N-acetylmuramoylalanine--D-glutamate ligase
METNGAKKIAILGGGESGVGAALLAKHKGFDVFVSDKGLLGEKYEKVLTENHIDFEEGKHTEELILEADEIIKSPGIPGNVPILEKAKAKNIPIISEIEFASRYTNAKLIAITGSNGKTTTTLLTYHLLKAAGFNVGLGGNVGDSFAKQVIEDKYEYWVLEISSFQLDDCYKFKPDFAVILNITPDHLDRYDYNFQHYVNAKMKIVQNADKDTHFIYFKDNQAIARELKKHSIPGQHYPISIQEVLENGAFLRNNQLEFVLKKTKENPIIIPTADIPLKGKHNMVNVMTAVLICLKLGIDESVLKEYFSTFTGVEHRLEEVETINGIRFINDSKATNVDSVFYALDSFEEKIILIAGGVDKGNDYTKIRDLVHQKVKFLICLGKDNKKLVDFFRDSIRIIYQTEDIKDAVEQAFELARKGDIVLLSPACASFDLFENYEDRGRQFKKAVSKLSKLNTLKG